MKQSNAAIFACQKWKSLFPEENKFLSDIIGYMHIITSGSKYIDIDAYAGAIAYAELLQLQGQQAKAISTAAWNESISKTVRSWQATLETTYKPAEVDEGNSYFVCKDPALQVWLANLLGAKFGGDVAKADRLWLRKEIIKQGLEAKV